MRHSEIRVRIHVRRIKRGRVQHPKGLSIACRRGAALGVNECVVELADLHITLLHEGLVRTRQLTGDLLSQAASTGDPESRKRYAMYRAVYESITGPSFDFVAIMESVGDRNCDASFLLGERYAAEWKRTSNIEVLKLAFHWLIVSAQLGCVDSLANLGMLLTDLGKPDTALEIWSIAARRGHCGALQSLVGGLARRGLCVMAPNATEGLRFVKNAERLAIQGAVCVAAPWLSIVLRRQGWDIFDLVAAVRLARRPPGMEADLRSKVLLFGESGPALIYRPWAFFAPYLSKRRSYCVPEFQFEVVAESGDAVELPCGIVIPIGAQDSRGESPSESIC